MRTTLGRRTAGLVWLLSVPVFAPACADDGGPSRVLRTSERLGVTHTVCPVGSSQGPCDFASPAACAIGAGVTDGDICLVKGGTYFETVTYQSSPPILRSGLVIQCDVGQSCIIDGEGVRDNAVNGYTDWVIQGFEITGTRSNAITSYRRTGVVRDCYIHDVGGRGIEKLNGTATLTAIVERNIIENTWDFGVICTAPNPTGTLVIKNNLLVDTSLGAGSGISCGNFGVVTHNTVVLADRTPPYAAPAPYAILSGTARYNVAVGANVSISAGTASGENLAFGAASASYAGVAPAAGDAIGDPSFIAVEDYHLASTSPAVDTATTSAETEDLEQTARPQGAAPDKGAFERVAGYVAKTPRWPVRETVEHIAFAASPAMALGNAGPAMAFIDDGANNLRFAQRQSDGVWRKETVESALTTPILAPNGPNLHSVALAVDPTNDDPVIAFVATQAGQAVLRVVRRTGDACGTDCTSPQWSGCGDTPAFATSSSDSLSFQLVFAPDNLPAIVLWQAKAGECGANDGYHVRYLKQQAGGGWAETEVATSLPGCTGMIPPGVDLSYSPVDGSAEIAFSRTTGNTNDLDPWYSRGILQVATASGATWTSNSVGLGTGNSTFGGGRSYIAVAHLPNGDLGVALSAVFGASASDSGVGFIERRSGVWDADMTLMRFAKAPSAANGVDLEYDSNGAPVVAFTTDGTLQLARRVDPTRWDVRYVDGQRTSGYWPTLRLTNADGVLIGHQQEGSDRKLKFQSTVDPGGIAPGYSDPIVCDRCPGDPAKTDPGLCGCGNPEDPEISVADAQANEGTGNLDFTLSLSSACDAAVSVSYATSDGSAIAGSDYVATSGVAQWTPGTTDATVSVPLLDDAVNEPTESFTVGLSLPSGGTINDGTALGTIIDDDPAAGGAGGAAGAAGTGGSAGASGSGGVAGAGGNAGASGSGGVAGASGTSGSAGSSGGNAGAAGGGGTAGSGASGASGSGGSAGSSGGAGGAAGTADGGGGAGVSGNAGASGSPGTGGNAGLDAGAGAGGSGATDGDASDAGGVKKHKVPGDGCGCRTSGHPTPTFYWQLLLGIAGLGAWRRRRARDAS